MDTTHPTSFSAANPAKKDRNQAKSSTQPAPLLTRPKRAFGTARCTNLPTEKPLAKPWKPSGNGTRTTSNHIAGKGSGKTKIGTKTPQERAREAELESVTDSGRSVQDGGARTPMSSLIKAAAAKAAATGTPYQTAENCSKCRFDKLETSAYWHAQIKVAEAAGKHSVSAAFFRLALECHAQPFRNLQRELKHYVARHNSISLEILWIDLCKAYGVSNDSFSTDPCDLDKLDAVLFDQEDLKPNIQDEANCETLKDECFEFDIIDKEAIELTGSNLILTADDVNREEFEEFVDVKAMPARNVTGAEVSKSSKNKGKKEGKDISPSLKSTT